MFIPPPDGGATCGVKLGGVVVCGGVTPVIVGAVGCCGTPTPIGFVCGIPICGVAIGDVGVTGCCGVAPGNDGAGLNCGCGVVGAP